MDSTLAWRGLRLQNLLISFYSDVHDDCPVQKPETIERYYRDGETNQRNSD